MGFGKIGKAFKSVGRGLGRLTGNLTGGLIGESDAERNQKRMLEEQKREADRQADLYRQQITEETKRRNNEADKAAAEAQRARDEQTKLLRETEERAAAEEDFKKRLVQDSASITNALLNQSANKQTTNVDYSNAVNADITDSKDDDIDKLKKAFKRKL
ncbi:hypothetical protein FNU4_2 [Fusobacterium phage vB_FnuS_FNU4]|nr:hypothetical protein FNU4_2 [Fusobacterium phage vB_FnuS_FNU4]